MNISNIKNSIKNFLKDFNDDEQKRNNFMMIFIVFIGIVSVFVGFRNSFSNINKPFVSESKEVVDNVYDTYNRLKQEGKIPDENSDKKDSDDTKAYSASRDVDSDGDNISDYDESNVFKTSPFLIDSDGDGFSDYDEIKSGEDPNCPRGKNCSVVASPEEEKAKQSISVNYLENKNLDTKQIREELYKVIPDNLKPMLASMTDEQVISLVDQLYQNQELLSSGDSGLDYKNSLKSKLPQFTPSQISTMKGMSELDIKKMLIDSNIADESLLSKFKEGELKSIVVGE